jgi:hypothetical protein
VQEHDCDAYRLQFSPEVEGKCVLPEFNLIGELCTCDSEGFWRDVHALLALVVGKEGKGDREVVDVKS